MNYFAILCPACGDEFGTHEECSEHLLKCRPDLYHHEIGDDCTRPGEACYWDHGDTEQVLSYMKDLEKPSDLLSPEERAWLTSGLCAPKLPHGETPVFSEVKESAHTDTVVAVAETETKDDDPFADLIFWPQD